MQWIPADISTDFMGKSRAAGALSVTLVSLSIIALLFFGPFALRRAHAGLREGPGERGQVLRLERSELRGRSFQRPGYFREEPGRGLAGRRERPAQIRVVLRREGLDLARRRRLY